LLPNVTRSGFGELEQTRICREAEHVVNVAEFVAKLLEAFHQLRHRERRVTAHDDRGCGTALFDRADDSLEHRRGAREACALPGRNSAEIKWPDSPSNTMTGWNMCWS